ncbi:MAG: response regulator [Desulfobacteraceae bacterium]|nr:response regulator [Desulfobacteraceae bacterium]
MSNYKILVVDDSPTDLKVITGALKDGGYDIITAQDGEEALERVSAETVHLVVLDVIMPKLNGFQVCRRIKSSRVHKRIKVIILTSKKQDSDIFWGKKQGADLYMTKPFEKEELLSNVASLI